MPIPALMGTSTHLKREEVPSLDLNFDGTTSSATGDPHFDDVLINLDGTSTTANLLPSIDMSDTAFWQRNTNLSVTSGQTDPFGGTQAHFLDDQNQASYSSLRETITGVAPGDYTASVYIKKTATAASKFRMRLWLGPVVTGTPTAEFAVDTQNGVVSGDATAKIEVFNSTYYRVSVTGTNVDQTELSLDFIPANAQTYSGASDPGATGGHTLYKPQIEAGSVATNALIIEGTLTTGTTDGSTIAHPFGNAPVPYIEYGSTPNYQRVPLSVDLSGGDWTMEMWARFDSVASYRSILSSGYNGGWQFGIAPSTTQLQFDYSSVSVLHTTSLSTGQWYYVTLSYVDATNTIYVGVDGVVVSGSNAAFGTVTSQLLGGSNAASASVGAGHAFVIGSNRGHNAPHYGQLTQVRITKGVARYVQTFGNPTTYPPTAKDASVGTRLATSIVTQGKGGTVQSKYMGPDGKLINGYVTNLYPGTVPSNNKITFTTNQGTAPDGTNTAIKAAEDYANGEKDAGTAGFGITSGTQYTVSLFAKPDGRPGIRLLLPAAHFGDNLIAHYDLQGNGSILEWGGTNTPDATTITAVGNGWYRISITGTATSTASTFLQLVIDNDATDTNTIYQGDGSSGLLIWGIQVEVGAAPSQLVQTTSGSASDQVARVEYDASGNPLGLLVEEQRTNLLPNTEDLSNYSLLTFASPDPDTAVAPDGTTTADSLVEDTTASNVHYARNTISVTSGTTYTYSVYVKANTRDHVRVVLGDANNAFPSGDTGINVDLTDGSYTGGTALDASSVTSVGNGWWRVSVTSTAASTTNGYAYVFLHDGTSASYTGDGTSSIYVWGSQLEESAVANQYVSTIGASASDQVARIEYDASGNPLGLLVEEQRTNIYPGTVPTNNKITFTTNQGTAPDGTNTAIKATEDSALGEKDAGTAGFDITSGKQYTASLFAKPNGRPGIRLLLPGAHFGDNLIAHYDLQGNGSILEWGGTNAPDATTITPAGNGWYRISITGTASSTANTYVQLVIDDDATDTNTSYQGDGSSGLLIWGIQVEEGEGPTSYIPTTTTSLTRPADDITLATSDFGVDPADATLVVQTKLAHASTNTSSPRLYELHAGSNNDRNMLAYSDQGASAIKAQFVEGGATTTLVSASSVAYPFETVHVQRREGTSGTVAVDGTLGTSSSVTQGSTTPTELVIGQNLFHGAQLNAHIRRFTYWPRAISDEQLAEYSYDLNFGGRMEYHGILSLNEVAQSRR